MAPWSWRHTLLDQHALLVEPFKASLSRSGLKRARDRSWLTGLLHTFFVAQQHFRMRRNALRHIRPWPSKDIPIYTRNPPARVSPTTSVKTFPRCPWR